MDGRRLDELTDEELKEVALEKGRRGVASARALRAQQILCERVGKWSGSQRRGTASDSYAYGESPRFTKRFK